MQNPLTLKHTQSLLFGKDISVTELIDSYLERIGKKDELINSFITVSSHFAKKEAKAADELINTKGKDILKMKPLFGSVVSHKDLFLTKGIETTAASNVLKGYIPQYSSTVVDRLHNAGAIIVGKNNCDAWAHGASGENSDFGPTKNPWNLDFVPGGSSSGSAASVAANFSLFSTGTDTGGSVRQPANFCGVVGLKPTYGAVPRYGVIAMASSLDSLGHMARCVSDVETIFNITRGPDGKDATVKDYSYKSNKKGSFKIGVPKEYFIDGIDSEVKSRVEKAIKVFEEAGVDIESVSLPHTKYAISVYYIVQPAEVSSNLGRYDGIRYGEGRDAFSAEAKRRIMLGTYVLSAGYYDAYYLKAMKVRSIIIEDFNKVFEKVDALIAPVSPTKAFKIGEKSDDPLEMYLADVLTVAANLAGIPGLALPYGFSQNGLPMGFQLMGPRFSEDTLFSLGKLFEKQSNYQPKVANL